MTEQVSDEKSDNFLKAKMLLESVAAESRHNQQRLWKEMVEKDIQFSLDNFSSMLLLAKRRESNLRSETRRLEKIYADDQLLSEHRHKHRLARIRAQGIPQEDFELASECDYCLSGKNIVPDHIVPICWHRWFGIDSAVIGKKENIASACFDCNREKNLKMPDSAPHLSIAKDLLGFHPKHIFHHIWFWLPPSARARHATLF